MVDYWSFLGEVGGLAARMKTKHRIWLRKKDRALEEAFPGKVHWRWLEARRTWLRSAGSLRPFASHTCQRGLGAGFQDNEELRKRFDLFGGLNQLRVHLLEIDGRPRLLVRWQPRAEPRDRHRRPSHAGHDRPYRETQDNVETTARSRRAATGFVVGIREG